MLRYLAVLMAVSSSAVAADDCAAYSKAVRAYLAKAAIEAEPLKVDATDPSKSEICYLSLKQDGQGFIESLNLARCPTESRTAIGTALFKAQPLPKPELASCRQHEINVSLQKTTVIEERTVP